MEMTKRLLSCLVVGALLAQPSVASAQDADDQDDGTVEFECPEDLSGLPDLIQRRCRDATAQGLASPVEGLNSSINRRGVKVFIPVAAFVASGIALSTLKDDKPVSR